MPDNFKRPPAATTAGAVPTFVAADSAPDVLTPANALKAADTALQSIDGELAAKAHKAIVTAKTVMSAAQALQGGDMAAVIAATTPLAGIAVPELSRLTEAVSGVSDIAKFVAAPASLPSFATPPFVQGTFAVPGGSGPAQFVAAPASLPSFATPPFVPATLIPDEHPLGGQAVQDFIAKPEFYAPPMTRLRDSLEEGRGVLEDRDCLLRLHAPLSGDKRLYASTMEGSGALSDLYCYRLQLLSRNAAIDLQEVMGNSFTVGIKLADGNEHPINGYVTAFGFARTDGGLAVYSAELRPWLWYLGTRINSRIFQDMSALDVLDLVFKDYGGLPDYQVRVNRRPSAETYIVQYDESDLSFVSRLLERHGLFYYFEHRADGHSLVISDDSADSTFCPPQSNHAVVRYNAGNHVDAQDTLTSLAAYRSFQPSAVALNTFKYTDPYAAQYVEQPTVAQQGDVPKLTVYHGNPAYAFPDKKAGSRDAQHLMEAYEWQAKLFMAQSQCRGIVTGHTFQLSLQRQQPDHRPAPRWQLAGTIVGRELRLRRCLDLVTRTLSNLPGVERYSVQQRAGRTVRRSGTTYRYDAQGRLQEKVEQPNGFRPQHWRYRWDADNRLVELVTPKGERWRYAYDGLGRRIRKLKVIAGGLRDSASAGVGIDNPGGGSATAKSMHAKRIVVGEEYLWSRDQLIEAAPIYADGTVA